MRCQRAVRQFTAMRIRRMRGWRPPEAYGVYAEEINAHFQGLFPNREEFVFHELLSDLVHIDVNIMRPDETHPYYVMYTTGMSDMPMTLPEEIQDREDLRYGELYMFLPKEWNPGEAGQIQQRHCAGGILAHRTD